MSWEAWGTPPDPEREPCPVCGKDAHDADDDCPMHLMHRRAVDAEQNAFDLKQRIAEMEKDAQNVMAELDAMNANFQGMLKDRNAWRDKARELEKDAARYQRLKARDFCIDKEITAANADATIDAHMNDA